MSRRALVLGGGGITGIAWETGLVAGLAEAGVDLAAADRVVGTSAGSIVGCQLACGLDPAELYRRQLLPPADLGDGDVPVARMSRAVLLGYGLALLESRGDVQRFGRAIGRRSLSRAAYPSTPTVGQRYAQVRKRIEGLTWPDRDVVVTAVDARSGGLALYGPRGARPGVSLEDAVNASCAVPCVYPPVPIEGRDYVDGGVRSGANADLAAGCDVVVCLAPADRALGPMRSAASQLAELGVPHLLITPDDDARRAIGDNVLDPAARPASARAGHAQAATLVDRVRELWG